jgi:glycosyltransferase involved in cell wall biosynthesis
MTSYNREKYISEAIESVLNQTHTDFELIILDDCSKDNTFQIINEFAKVDKRIRAFKNERNIGQFENRNKIASFAKDSPEVSIDLSQAPSREVIQAVREGYADIGICDSSEIYSDLASRAYRKEELVLIVPTNHPLASHKKLAFSQALDYDLIGVYGSSMIQQLLEKAASSSGHILRQRIKVSSLSALCRMVESRNPNHLNSPYKPTNSPK